MVHDPAAFRRAEIIWEKGTNRAEFKRGEVAKYTIVSNRNLVRVKLNDTGILGRGGRGHLQGERLRAADRDVDREAADQ